MTSVALPSIYGQNLWLVTANGDAMPLDKLKGRPMLATMFFASCPDVCPLMTERLMRVWHRLPEKQRARLRVLMVSFDSMNDRPVVLRSYADAHRITDPNWTLGVADAPTTERLGALLNVQFRRLGPGSFSHEPMMNLVTADGVIMARLPSATLGTALFGAAVDGLLES